MNLNIFDNRLDNKKDENFLTSFLENVSDCLKIVNEKVFNKLDNNKDVLNKLPEKKVSELKEEGTLYQVVELLPDGAYIQNINTNKVYLEKDISKDTLNKAINDTILRYKNGQYIVEEELTQKFFDNLVDFKEYKNLQQEFIKSSNILENDANTLYKIKEYQKDYTILSYDTKIEKTLKVPNSLIPFFAKYYSDSILVFKDGEFKRKAKYLQENL